MDTAISCLGLRAAKRMESVTLLEIIRVGTTIGVASTARLFWQRGNTEQFPIQGLQKVPLECTMLEDFTM